MNNIQNNKKTFIRSLTGRIAKFGLLLGLLLTQFSCYKDLGNYDYKELDTVVIDTADLGMLDTYSVSRYENIILEPSVYFNGSRVTDASDVPLDYFWTIGTVGTGAGVIYRLDTLATTIKLDAPIVQPAGSWTLMLVAKHRETNIETYMKFNVTIEESITDGWMVLYERNGNTDIGLIANNRVKKGYTEDTERLFLDAYSSSNGEPLNGKPVSFKHSIGGIGFAGGGDIIVASEHDAAVVNLTFTKLFDYQDLFWTTPGGGKNLTFWKSGGPGSSAGGEIMINNNKVHRYVGGNRNVNKYQDAYAGTYGELAAWVPDYLISFDALVYDQTNTRFLGVPTSGVKLSTFPNQAVSAPFDINNTGMQMVDSDYGYRNYEYSLMKNGNTYALLTSDLYTTNISSTNIAKGYYDMSTSPDIANATTVSAGTLGSVFYYGAGNGVYLFRPGSGNPAVKAWEAPAGEVVTCVRIQKYYYTMLVVTGMLMNNNLYVYVSTWNEATQTGTVHQMAMNPTNGSINAETDRSYTGFGKVKDMGWKWVLAM
ncbi:MAG: PKD-like family lipoprotein [Bacteroidales bacterium]|nr:PKD-like family lipoprotein [Bacteroidales bacterium]MDD3988689.1 PKD-like family lipoprotein [Bacteroidales bacterium]